MIKSTNLQIPAKNQNVRLINILRSPKKNGSSDIDSEKYLRELGISIDERRQLIQFSPNYNERIHRWAPYVQGFSASFVQSVLERYIRDYKNPYIMDPFAGCGTVLVQSKLNGLRAFGVELNPFLQFVAETKLNSWDVSSTVLLKTFNSLNYKYMTEQPAFLKSEKQFREGILRNLRRIKGAIDSYLPKSNTQKKIKDLLKLAFSAIIIDSSNLKRSPCLGYDKTKVLRSDTPITLFNQKVHQIAEDLKLLKEDHTKNLKVSSNVVCANSMDYCFPDKYDLVITSPPYMNGMDYVMNYKIEMAWLGFTKSHRDAKKIKDNMVVCDNVSKGLIKDFSKSKKYTNEWIENIKRSIFKNIEFRGAYRRTDMPEILNKYFDDMYKIMKNVAASLKKGGRFILVIGDSLIADVYVPTDLIIAKIGEEIGLKIECIELARNRRSGQIRSYRLRETVVTLKK